MYAKLEENHGLARHAMTIYERATKAVLPEEQFEVRFTMKLTERFSILSVKSNFAIALGLHCYAL